MYLKVIKNYFLNRINDYLLFRTHATKWFERICTSNYYFLRR